MRDTLMSGLAGEHLVCADIRKSGYIAFTSAQDCTYDVVMDIGSRLLKVQVKTAGSPCIEKRAVNPVWMFNLRKTGGAYLREDFDILAAVAIDLNKVAYIAPNGWDRQGLRIRSRKYDYTNRGVANEYYFEDLPLEKALTEYCLPAISLYCDMNWSDIRKKVLDRDEGRCVRCGRDAQHVHHRKLKGMGGTSNDKLKYGFDNLVSLCFDCHSQVHAHPADSYNAGYLVHSWDDPAAVFIVAKFGVLTLRKDGTSDMQGSCGPLF